MLSTAGLVPVAQEFCGAGMPRFCGSEFSPVSAECPSAMMPRSGFDAEVVPLGGLAGAVLAAADAGPPLELYAAASSPAESINNTIRLMARAPLWHGCYPAYPAAGFVRAYARASWLVKEVGAVSLGTVARELSWPGKAHSSPLTRIIKIFSTSRWACAKAGTVRSAGGPG